MMILTNEMYKLKVRPRSALQTLAQLLMPFAPHLSEEIWDRLGGKGFVSLAPWPKFDESLVIDAKVTMGVQINGKMRGKIQIDKNADEKTAVNLAKRVTSVANAIKDKKISKVIYKPGRILNLIIN